MLDKQTNNYCPLDQREYDQPLGDTHATDELLIWNRDSRSFLNLVPLIITFYESDISSGELLFLEEIKGKHLLYLYDSRFLKKKEEFHLLINLLNKRMVETEKVSSSELSSTLLGEWLSGYLVRFFHYFFFWSSSFPL